MDKKEKVEKTKKEALSFFTDLFKFEKSFLLKFIFFIHIVIQILVLVWYLVTIFSTGDILKILGWIVLYPLVFFAIRFMFELISIQFSINENLVSIKKLLKK